jgi:hypothetical protein
MDYGLTVLLVTAVNTAAGPNMDKWAGNEGAVAEIKTTSSLCYQATAKKKRPLSNEKTSECVF